MKVKLKDCYQLDDDYHNILISNEVQPEPQYIKSKLVERTYNKIHYKDVFILESQKYYKITLDKKISELGNDCWFHQFDLIFVRNGLFFHIDKDKDCIYLYNAGGNNVFLRKGTIVGEVIKVE